MITLKRCARLAGLDLDGLVVGVAPEPRHHTLLQSYRLNLHRGQAAVRRMIIGDLLGCMDIGAQRCAADLLVVLRLFRSEQSAVACAPRLPAPLRDRPFTRHHHAPPERARAGTSPTAVMQ
jgi:hypothetical protein